MDLDLTPDEAIVLFEILRRYSDDNVLGIEDQAEQRALWNLQCVLETRVGTLFEGTWESALGDSRSRLRDEGTSAESEQSKGRVAVWLDPADISAILEQWRRLPSEPLEVVEQWGRIAFRLNTALHKAGLK